MITVFQLKRLCVLQQFSCICCVRFSDVSCLSSRSGVAMSASVPSPDNHHSAAMDTSNSHKLYRTSGPNGTATSCPPPSVSEPYSPPKVALSCSHCFQYSIQTITSFIENYRKSFSNIPCYC